MSISKKNTKLWVLLLIIITLILFWLKGALSLDPDFGYRLTTGQKILSGTFPKTDPYSYTMPSFLYVEHAWIIAASWAFLYPLISMSGLAAISAIVAFAAIIVSSSINFGIKKPKLYKKILGRDMWCFGQIPFVLAITTILPFAGVRAQVFSWLFVSAFLYILLNEKLWYRFRLFTPLLFLLWANVHGSWPLGLFILATVTFARSIRLKKLFLKDILIVLVSFAVTLINPYGIGAWQEVWQSLSDTSIRWRIAEWMPSFLFADLGFISFFSFSVLFVAKYRKRFKLEIFLLYVFMLVQAMLSRRHIPLWVLIALPMTSQSIRYLYEEVARIKLGIKRLKELYKYALFGSFGILIFWSMFTIKDSLAISEASFYPVGAVEYLKQNTPENRIFSTYRWGGYLIQHLPEKKVFIYGGMPSWRRDNTPESESSDAFTNYRDILAGELDHKEVFEKYNIDTVLVSPPTDAESPLDKLQSKLDNFLTIFGREKSDFDFRESLKENGWETVYEDEISIIYKNSSK